MIEYGLQTRLLTQVRLRRNELGIKPNWQQQYNTVKGSGDGTCLWCNATVKRSKANSKELEKHLFDAHYEIWEHLATKDVVNEVLAKLRQEKAERKRTKAAARRNRRQISATQPVPSAPGADSPEPSGPSTAAQIEPLPRPLASPSNYMEPEPGPSWEDDPAEYYVPSPSPGPVEPGPSGPVEEPSEPSGPSTAAQLESLPRPLASPSTNTEPEPGPSWEDDLAEFYVPSPPPGPVEPGPSGPVEDPSESSGPLPAALLELLRNLLEAPSTYTEPEPGPSREDPPAASFVSSPPPGPVELGSSAFVEDPTEPSRMIRRSLRIRQQPRPAEPKPRAVAPPKAMYLEAAHVIPVIEPRHEDSGSDAIQKWTKCGRHHLEWELEGIAGHRLVKNSRGTHFEYKIMWRDCAETTWEVASRLKHAPDTLWEYRTKNNLWRYVLTMKM